MRPAGFLDHRVSALPLYYFNRYSQRVETEQIYGERWLRWIYGSPLGRVALHALVKRSAFSRWYGWRMDSPASRKRVAPFIRNYGLDSSEFLDPVDSFQTFNEFFYRRLKPSARPIDPRPEAVVFPADGRHLGFADVSLISGIFVKGETLSLTDLLQDTELATDYRRGTMIISRLCPVDYHRYHFPVSGVPQAVRRIEGPLFSVNPIALRQDIRILARNRRWITVIDSPTAGRVLMLEVGATNVGSAVSTFNAGRAVVRGDEKGYFRFGGSLTLCLFLPGRVQLSEDLRVQTGQGRELYARMGDSCGLT